MVEWADVPGYEGLYRVNKFGTVERLQWLLPRLHEEGVRRPLRELSQIPRGRGQRLSVCLCKNNSPKWFQVHRLVLLAFVGPCPEGMEGRHLDGNHLNNWLGNLEWATHEVNMQDKTFHGTQLIGVKSPRAKLTEDDVKEIRVAPGTERELAAKYGVSQVAVHFIRTRKTWKHVP